MRPLRSAVSALLLGALVFTGVKAAALFEAPPPFDPLSTIPGGFHAGDPRAAGYEERGPGPRSIPAPRAFEEGGKTDPDRIEYCFRRCLARRPTDDERAELLALLGRARARLAEGWTSALEVATGKNQPPARLPGGATPTQLGAMTVVTRVLLNLDETITKE